MGTGDVVDKSFSRLLLADDPRLFGTRKGDTPFALLDVAAKRCNQPEWVTLVPRIIVNELLAGGLICDDATGDESVRQCFRLSDYGRSLSPKSTVS